VVQSERRRFFHGLRAAPIGALNVARDRVSLPAGLIGLTRLERICLSIVALLLILAAVGPYVAPFPTETGNLSNRLAPPSWPHILGTDENGMDILSRILAAPRSDVTAALVAVALAVCFGACLGVIAGYFEGSERRLRAWGGAGILRLLDVVQAFPVFILALVLVALRGNSLVNIIIAIAFVNMPVFIRLVRTEVLSLREAPFAEAARVAGNRDLQIGFKHLLPNALSPMVAQISVSIGFAIILTAGLSFVGAGVSPPTPELGAMIASGSSELILGHWWPSVFPGIALGLTVFAFAVVGDGVGRVLLGPGRFASVEISEAKRLGLMSAPLSIGDFGDTVRETLLEKSVGHENGTDQAPRPSSREDDAGSIEEGTTAQPLLSVANLVVGFGTSAGVRTALDDVSFSLHRGETLAIVGETGAGKSVLVRSILRLLPENAHVLRGAVQFEGEDLLAMPDKTLRSVRGSQIAAILPDAKSQLNPVLRVGDLMVAGLRSHQKISRRDARARATSLLKLVGIPDPERRLRAFPRELSGGMAQRVCIALAIMHNPALIIADEPTAGLDVTVQRQVLDLMADLVLSRNTAQLVVTRDLGIVAHYSQRVAVMQSGRIVEVDQTPYLFEDPRHSYTRRLVAAAREGVSS
jgi:ABC-type dipeptide/oligopeptide/nickel transport system ATPase component/ABC-type dipeptide/oligopeptide/nickel transport system permease subunit